MGNFKIQCDYKGIRGLCLLKPQTYHDNRGYFFEAYSEKDLSFLDKHFVQDNQTYSKAGVLRGFGINIKKPQAKLIRVLSGKIFDVVIDLRKNSSTYLKWSGIELSKENGWQLYIPEGFAHAYLALEDSEVLFKVTTHYIAGNEVGFAWDSKSFSIDWPLSGEPILGDRDKNNPEFQETMLG